jgi:polysaccharide biosynthesis/export protein
MLMQQRALAFLAIIVMLSTSGTITFSSASAQTQYQSAAAPQYESAPSSSSPGDYVLGPNDRVRLKVYGEADISGEYEIDNTGQVSIPLAGHIRAAGLTTKELERAIAAALAKGIVRDPRVNVEVALYRPYYILGEVKKSGEYPYRLGLTVLDAVASAGGFTYRANESKVYVRRSGSGAEQTYSLDTPIMVYPGDNIRVPERFF